MRFNLLLWASPAGRSPAAPTVQVHCPVPASTLPQFRFVHLPSLPLGHLPQEAWSPALVSGSTLREVVGGLGKTPLRSLSPTVVFTVSEMFKHKDFALTNVTDN